MFNVDFYKTIYFNFYVYLEKDFAMLFFIYWIIDILIKRMKICKSFMRNLYAKIFHPFAKIYNIRVNIMPLTFTRKIPL